MSGTPTSIQQFDEEGGAKMESEISFISKTELDQIVQTAGFATLTRVYQSFLWGAWWTRHD